MHKISLFEWAKYYVRQLQAYRLQYSLDNLIGVAAGADKAEAVLGDVMLEVMVARNTAIRVWLSGNSDQH